MVGWPSGTYCLMLMILRSDSTVLGPPGADGHTVQNVRRLVHLPWKTSAVVTPAGHRLLPGTSETAIGHLYPLPPRTTPAPPLCRPMPPYQPLLCRPRAAPCRSWVKNERATAGGTVWIALSPEYSCSVPDASHRLMTSRSECDTRRRFCR